MKKKVCTLLENNFFLVYHTCCYNCVIRDINCKVDCYMFLVTNNRQGFDTLSPTILNHINIYDSNSNHHKKLGHHRKGTVA